MTFNSVAYALFLPVAVLGHWALRGRARMAWLLAASYAFYGSWDGRFLLLLWLSTAIDFFVAQAIERNERMQIRRRYLAASLTAQLLILATFKYFDFFVDGATDLLGRVGLDPGEPTLSVILPVGVSFYTFQTMAYTIDVFRRRTTAVRDPLLFATFVAFFPQLVAGPIERANHILPQLAADRPFPRWERIQSGLTLLFLGLFKKVVIGDTMAPIVNDVFADPGTAGSIGVALGIVAFAIQIYADFSGYTDMARGSARLLGIELRHNFTQPYLSRSVTEFWRRWHMSLSTWLRDYLYIPLGGNQKGELRTEVNLMATMLLGGLWHGASWHFVAWGGLHGLYLAAHRRWRRDVDVTDALPTRARAVLATVATFALVCLAWVFFRAASIDQALDVLHALVTGGLTVDLDGADLVVIMTLLTLALDLAGRLRTLRAWRPERSPLLAGAGVGAALAAVAVFSGGEPVPFIYFQF
jgi:D-alanyl-lipoteichoic acid acyltransferase DltB (MBOAT superfamily)